uniref:Uncharacterized protein n=1 Tax=Helianthus annuus TaxID=4232 RepID=A0A251S1K8_HELAN
MTPLYYKPLSLLLFILGDRRPPTRSTPSFQFTQLISRLDVFDQLLNKEINLTEQTEAFRCILLELAVWYAGVVMGLDT